MRPEPPRPPPPPEEPAPPPGQVPWQTLPIRAWLLLALLSVFVVPAAAMVGAVALNRVINPAEVQGNFIKTVAISASSWRDPRWQDEVRTRANAVGMTVLVSDAAGAELFRSGPDPAPRPYSSAGAVQNLGRSLITQQVVVPDQLTDQGLLTVTLIRYDDSQPVAPGGLDQRPAALDPRLYVERLLGLTSPAGRALIARGLLNLLVPLGGLGALLAVCAGVTWFIGRGVLRPLAAMSRAAHRVAAGDLTFTLPPSNVREVAEVATALHRMAGALRGSIERQAELEQERRLFIGAIAHDLHTPLFSLRGYLAGLEQGIATTPQRVARYVAICQEQVAALDRLVADLFAYVQTEYLHSSSQRATLDLATVLEQAVDGLRPQAQAKGVALVLDRPAGPCVLEGDGHSLVRAVGNLLDNTVRHTPPGGAIRVGGGRAGQRLVFDVADSGPGIAPRDLPHLFTPLYRGETSRNRRTGGAGLGLTIARRILQAHEGDLWAANAAGGGAVFYGQLPAAPDGLVPSVPQEREKARCPVAPSSSSVGATPPSP